MRRHTALESFGQRCAWAGPHHVGSSMRWGKNLPFTIPLSRSFFEELVNGGANVVLRVKPRKLLVGVERCSPYEATVVLVLHAEQREVEAGEVVVVDAAVDKGCRKTDLADVLLDGELGCPQRERPPVLAEYRVVGHA